ncbi:G5 domain-containing protein [Streptococcus sanguinis]
MNRKKLIKLGITVLAINALGAAAAYQYPELVRVPSVYAEEPGEDEEIPDAAEAQAAANFKNQLDVFEAAINEFNPNDADTAESLQYALDDVNGYHQTAVNAIKSPEGQKGFAKYETRYQALKAKAEALLKGESPKEEPKVTTQEITVTEPVLYGTQTVQTNTLAKGEKRTKVQGVNGEKSVTYTITLTDGKETARAKKNEVVTKPAVDEVIEVGTGVVTTEEVTETEEVAYNTREVSSDQLAEGVRQVKTPGQKGVKTIVYTVTKTDGKETGRVKKSESITKDPVEEVVEVGTGVITTEEVSETEVLKHGSKTVENPELAKGVRQVKTAGQDGSKVTTYTVTKKDGKEVSKVQKGEPVVTAAIDEVVEVGTKESPVAPVVTTEEVTETEEVAYNTREVSSDQLAEGVRQVKTPGQKGVKTIVYTVTKTDGKETGRVKKSESITKDPVEEVVEVGTGVITTEEVSETEVLKHGSKTVENPELAKGVRQVKTAGQDGSKVTTYTVTKKDGKEVSKVQKGEPVVTAAIDEVVEVGTKVSTDNTNPSQVPSGQGQEGQTGEKKVLPKTGENSNILLSIMGLMLAAFAGFINRKKRQD